MKKIKFLALMMLAGSLVFTSCKDEDEVTPAPSISFSGGTSAVVPLTTDTNVVFNATVTAEGKIDALTVNEKKVEADGTVHSGTPTDVSDAKGETSFVYNFDMTFNAASFVDANGTYETLKYEMTVTDKEGQSLTKTYTVTLEDASSSTPFPTEITTGNFWHIEGPNAGAYDLDGDATVSSSGDITTKSMMNNDPATDASVASGFTGSWTSGNNTEFVKDNAFDYANATVEAATVAYATGSASGTVTNPAANDIYIAKKGNIIYVIKITDVTPEATKNNNGQIKFSYKKI